MHSFEPLSLRCAGSRVPRSLIVGVLAGVVAGLLAGHSSTADAQQRLYKIVGPDGQVTYTDRPPPVPPGARVAQPVVAAAPPTATLPADLAAVVTRYPVTLHTGPNCAAPCTEGRNLLRERGVPFQERTVSTVRDVAELERVAGATSLPVLVVGRLPLVGFRQSEWVGYLDAAGYPATSRLPANYSPPAPIPLTPPVAAAVPAAAPPPAPAAAAPTQPGAGGIRF
jgi:hypothetical protein